VNINALKRKLDKIQALIPQRTIYTTPLFTEEEAEQYSDFIASCKIKYDNNGIDLRSLTDDELNTLQRFMLLHKSREA